MNGESQIEVFLSIFVLGLATAFATDYVHLPYELVQSPIFVAIFLIVTLIAFPMFPMTAISLFFLLTIILFSRNLETTMSRAHTPKANVPYEQVHRLNNSPTMPPRPNWYSATVETHPVTEQPSQLMTGSTVYGEKSIPEHTVPVAAPYFSFKSDHRSFQEFNETDARNPVLGKIIENFEPANINSEQGSPVEGQYPKERARASSNPESREYTFRPSEDIGSNEFSPMNGPDLDHKMKSFKYNTNSPIL